MAISMRSAAKKMTGVLAIALAAIVMLLMQAGSASAAPVGTSLPGQYCGGWQGFYDSSGYIYGDVRLCLVINGSHTGELRVDTDKMTYKWGGVWYSASARHPVYWLAEGRLRNETGLNVRYVAVNPTQASRSGSETAYFGVEREMPMPDCGTYTATLDYTQTGPFWPEHLRSQGHPISIDVPCA